MKFFHRFLTLPKILQTRIVVGSMRGNAHHNPRPHFWADEACGQNHYRSSCDWIFTNFPNKLFGIYLFLLHDTEPLVFKFDQALLREHPSLTADSRNNILRIRINPDVCHAVNCLWPDSRTWKYQILGRKFYNSEFCW